MMRQTRRTYAPAFKTKVALAAIKGEKKQVDLARQFGIHPNLIAQWKFQLQKAAITTFGPGVSWVKGVAPADPKALHAKLEERILENGLLEDARSANSEKPQDGSPACNNADEPSDFGYDDAAKINQIAREIHDSVDMLNALLAGATRMELAVRLDIGALQMTRDGSIKCIKLDVYQPIRGVRGEARKDEGK